MVFNFFFFFFYSFIYFILFYFTFYCTCSLGLWPFSAPRQRPPPLPLQQGSNSFKCHGTVRLPTWFVCSLLSFPPARFFAHRLFLNIYFIIILFLSRPSFHIIILHLMYQLVFFIFFINNCRSFPVSWIFILFFNNNKNIFFPPPGKGYLCD